MDRSYRGSYHVPLNIEIVQQMTKNDGSLLWFHTLSDLDWRSRINVQKLKSLGSSVEIPQCYEIPFRPSIRNISQLQQPLEQLLTTKTITIINLTICPKTFETKLMFWGCQTYRKWQSGPLKTSDIYPSGQLPRYLSFSMIMTTWWSICKSPYTLFHLLLGLKSW